jgi:hypothetical protein
VVLLVAGTVAGGGCLTTYITIRGAGARSYNFMLLHIQCFWKALHERSYVAGLVGRPDGGVVVRSLVITTTCSWVRATEHERCEFLLTFAAMAGMLPSD